MNLLPPLQCELNWTKCELLAYNRLAVESLVILIYQIPPPSNSST